MPKKQDLLTDVAEKRQEIADVAGIQPGQVRSIGLELKLLRNKGILVSLQANGVGMFERKATYDEIGFQADDVRKGRISTGKKFLLPVTDEVRAFRSIATTMRNLVAKYSYDIPGFYPYKFMTYSAFQEKFKPKMAECIDLWKETVNNVCANLKDYTDRISVLSITEAEKSWNAMLDAEHEAVLIDGTLYRHDDYIDYCKQRDVSDIPTADEIRAGMKLDYVVAMVYGEADLASDQARADSIRNQAALEREYSGLENSLLAEQVRAEMAKNQIQEDLDRDRREMIIQEEANHIRQQLAEQGSPFDQIIKAARSRAADSAAEILLSIKKNGFVRGKVAEKGAGLKEYFDLMATHDDTYLVGLLTALEKQIGPIADEASPERDVAKITETLEKIMQLADSEFQTITSGPGRFSALEI